MTTLERTNAVQDYIRQTMGTENHWKHGFFNLNYTDGVKFVADTCGAHWLLDIIGSYQHKPRFRAQPFQVWQLTKEGERWAVRVWTDTPGESTRLTTQMIDYSDFPDDLLPFTLWVESGVVLLPAEH